MTPWRSLDLLVLDTETTGLDPDHARIVEVALVPILGGDTVGTGRSWLVHPGGPIPPEATAIHGIDDAMVQDAPRFGQGLGALSGQLVGSVLVAFNAPFDRAMVAAEWLRADPWGLMPAALSDRATWIDPLTWIREWDRYVSDQGRHKLATTCARRGVEHGDRHRALGDALACARLLLSLAPKLPSDLDELLGQQRALAIEHEKRRAEWIARGKPVRQSRSAEGLDR